MRKKLLFPLQLKPFYNHAVKLQVHWFVQDKKLTNGSAAAREPMAVQPAIACQNGRGVWLYKRPLHRHISDYFERSDWGVQLIARPGTRYSFHISGKRVYESNRVRSLSIFHSYCIEDACMGTSTITPWMMWNNYAVLWRGMTQHQDSRGSKRKGSQENTPSIGWAIGSTMAWVSSRKLIPAVYIVWIDQVNEGLEQCWSSEPIR